MSQESKSGLDFFDKEIFSEVGKKLQLFAKILFVVNIVGTIILIVFFYHQYVMFDMYNYSWMEKPGQIGIIFSIVSFIVAEIGTYVLYAFGQLVDDVHKKDRTEEDISIDELPEL